MFFLKAELSFNNSAFFIIFRCKKKEEEMNAEMYKIAFESSLKFVKDMVESKESDLAIFAGLASEKLLSLWKGEKKAYKSVASLMERMIKMLEEK